MLTRSPKPESHLGEPHLTQKCKAVRSHCHHSHLHRRLNAGALKRPPESWLCLPLPLFSPLLSALPPSAKSKLSPAQGFRLKPGEVARGSPHFTPPRPTTPAGRLLLTLRETPDSHTRGPGLSPTRRAVPQRKGGSHARTRRTRPPPSLREGDPQSSRDRVGVPTTDTAPTHSQSGLLLGNHPANTLRSAVLWGQCFLRKEDHSISCRRTGA